MAVIVVSRFKGSRNHRAPVREAAALLKRHGAVSVRAGRCNAGSYAGEIVVATTFADWAGYGRAMETVTADPAWQKSYAEFVKTFELTDRSVVVADEY